MTKSFVSEKIKFEFSVPDATTINGKKMQVDQKLGLITTSTSTGLTYLSDLKFYHRRTDDKDRTSTGDARRIVPAKRQKKAK